VGEQGREGAEGVDVDYAPQVSQEVASIRLCRARRAP
jgi:hypothetical protein